MKLQWLEINLWLLNQKKELEVLVNKENKHKKIKIEIVPKYIMIWFHFYDDRDCILNEIHFSSGYEASLLKVAEIKKLFKELK